MNGYPTKRVDFSPESSSLYYSNDEAGIRLHREVYPSEFVSGCGFTTVTITYSPPVLYAPADISVSATYGSSGTALVEMGCGSVQVAYTVTSSVFQVERIAVPLGTFEALQFIFNISVAAVGVSESASQTFWLAPQVGVLREMDLTTSGGSSSVGETYALVSTSIVRTQPDLFGFFFNPVTAPLGSQAISNPITVFGTTRPSPISVTGGEYRINGGAWTTSSGSVSNGQTVEVRVTTPSVNNASASGILTIGGVSAGFTVNSPFEADSTPDALGFTTQRSVPSGTAVTSNAISVTGINVSVPITITGGSYSVNGGPFTTGSSTVRSGDSIVVRVTSPSIDNAQACAVLTVGGVQAPFCVSTGPLGIDLRQVFQLLLGD